MRCDHSAADLPTVVATEWVDSMGGTDAVSIAVVPSSSRNGVSQWAVLATSREFSVTIECCLGGRVRCDFPAV